MGIRRGHLPAVVALEEGSRVRVVSGEKTVYAMDYNADGEITVTDALAILRKALGI